MGSRKSRRALLIALPIVLFLAHDVAVAPPQAFGARVALAGIDQYRAHISPQLRGIVQCRFTPTCSYYGRESIRKHGLLVGGAKTIWRIARCGPWTPLGTVDPP